MSADTSGDSPRASLIDIFGGKNVLPEYMRLRHRTVVTGLSEDAFAKKIIRAAEAKCRRDFQPQERPPPRVPILPEPPAAALTGKRSRGKAAPKPPPPKPLASIAKSFPDQHDHGRFVDQNVGGLELSRRLLLADWYELSKTNAHFVLCVAVDSPYYRKLEERLKLEHAPNYFRTIQLASGGGARGTSCSYLCVDAMFRAAPQKVTLDQLVRNEDRTEGVLQGEITDRFVVRLKALKTFQIPISLLDVIEGRRVLALAPLAKRGNRIADFLAAIKDDTKHKIAMVALLDELVGDSVQTFEVTSAWTNPEYKKLRRHHTHTTQRMESFRERSEPHKTDKEGTKKLVLEVEAMSKACLERSANNFVFHSSSLMEPKEFAKLISIAQTECPNVFQMQMKAISGSGRYQGQAALQARAFFMLLASLRQGNKQLLPYWASILGLANMKDGTPARATQYLARLGFCLSKSDMEAKFARWHTTSAVLPWNCWLPRTTSSSLQTTTSTSSKRNSARTAGALPVWKAPLGTQSKSSLPTFPVHTHSR